MNKPTYTIKPLYLGEMTRYEKSMDTKNYRKRKIYVKFYYNINKIILYY